MIKPQKTKYLQKENSAKVPVKSVMNELTTILENDGIEVRFDYDEAGSNTAALWGSTTFNGTHFTFMRLGDT